MTRSNDVWVLLESEDNRLGTFADGLIREGKRLSDEIGGDLSAVLLGPDIENLDELVGRHGANHLYRHRDERLANYDPDIYVALLTELLLKHEPRLLLSVASSLGSDLMPRVAAGIGAPLVTNCSGIHAADGIEFTKAVQNGRLQATLTDKTTAKAIGTSMATLDPEALPASEETALSQVAELREIKTDVTDIPKILHVTDYLKADPTTVDIREAEIVIAVGNGIGAKDNLVVFQTFAELIGAAIGGSRPVIDSGILPYERQVGQTGKKISPKLAILCGISGSEYFTKGIEQARTKVAINSDRNAPIFKDIDFGIVADVNALIPRFMEYIKQRAKGGAR
jgi:electron transfer flavoprotein alpha subunit